MADKKEHVLDIETGEHVSTSSGEDGACLVAHEYTYKDTDSCSHRWQGYRKAQEYSHWYNFPAYRSLTDWKGPSALRTALSQSNKSPNKFPPPKAGEWDLGASMEAWRSEGGVSVKKTVPNFRDLQVVPYWHQSHHIIPTSVMNDCLLEASETDMRLFWLVRVGLLTAKYNLSHKENVVILPMGKVVAKALCLPRHITGIESEPGVKKEIANHPIYNDRVKTEVKKVISEYADQIDMNNHDVELPAFTKAQLERISQTLFMRLRAWGKIAQGMGLDSMDADYFNF